MAGSHSLGKLALVSETVAQVVADAAIVGPDLHCLVIATDGFIVFALIEEDVAQVAVCEGVVRGDAPRLLKVEQSLVEPALLETEMPCRLSCPASKEG